MSYLVKIDIWLITFYLSFTEKLKYFFQWLQDHKCSNSDREAELCHYTSFPSSDTVTLLWQRRTLHAYSHPSADPSDIN